MGNMLPGHTHTVFYFWIRACTYLFTEHRNWIVYTAIKDLSTSANTAA